MMSHKIPVFVFAMIVHVYSVKCDKFMEMNSIPLYYFTEEACE